MPTPKKNVHAVAMSKLGASKGGYARAAKMTPEERSIAARAAINARWKNHVKTAKPLRTRKRPQNKVSAKPIK